MDHVINGSKSNKMTLHKSDSSNSREPMHVSQLSWLAHWRQARRQSYTNHVSQNNSELPFQNVRTKQASHGNLPQGPDESKFGTSEADKHVGNKSEEDSQKDGQELVEVKPSLLLPGASASISPTCGMLEPFKSNASGLPSGCSKNENHQCNSRETHGEHIMCTHSSCFENKRCQYCSHFTSLDAEEKVNVIDTADGGSSGTAKKFIRPLVGDFLFSRGEAKITLDLSDKEFSGSRKSMPRAAQIVGIPGTAVSNMMPACSIHDVETLRICTTVDKMEGVPWGASKCSKTTHHFLITKKTDVTFSKDDQLIKRSSVDSKIGQKSFLGMVGLPPSLYPYDKNDTWTKSFCKATRVVMLNEYTRGSCHRPNGFAEEGSTSEQARVSYPKSVTIDEIRAETGSSEASFEQPSALLVSEKNFTWRKSADDGEEMGDLLHHIVKTSSANVKCESSSEMEQLDLNIVMGRDYDKDVTSDAIHKGCVESETSCEPLQRMNPTGARYYVSPPCSGTDGSEDGKRKCASRTECLDAADLPAHAGQPGTSQSDFSHPDSDSSSRWVKRLKHSHSEAFGTKKSIIGHISCEDKRIKLISKVLNYSRSVSNSELLSSACVQKQQLIGMVSLPRRSKSAAELIRISKDILSDPWIRRWHSTKGPGIPVSSAEVICEPQCSKVSIIEMQGKEFPSLGAMALVGKALTNFRPCEFVRMGSLVVWKTQGH